MPPTIARVLLSVILWICLPFLWFCAGLLLDPILPYEFSLAGGGVVCTVVSVILWERIWSPRVHWTPTRRTYTFRAKCGTWVLAFLLTTMLVLLSTVRYFDRAAALVFGFVAAMLFWFVSTILIWRDTPQEQARRLYPRRVHCPRCGYDLKGLREARCPECGAAYTLDELLTRGEPADRFAGED